MTINTDYVALLIEATEWFDWMKHKARWHRFSGLTDELRVLFAIRSVLYANELEPKYFGRLPRHIRDGLIRMRLADQYREYVNSSVGQCHRKTRKESTQHARRTRTVGA